MIRALAYEYATDIYFVPDFLVNQGIRTTGLYVEKITKIIYNTDHFGWQNPIIYIERGYDHILTGDFKTYAEIEIGDAVYLYAGKKKGDSTANGIYGIGTVIDILKGSKNNAYAVVKITHKGDMNIPLISYYKDENLFYSWISSARSRHGHTELDSETAREIDNYL